jgi:Capsule polysaccharide biosynthesis protein
MLVEIETGAGARRVDIFSQLEPQDEERAHEDAYAWIKAVRHMRIDGAPLRSRFTLRGDSLWWFAELYLHKEQAIHGAMQVLRAVDRLVERERPRELRAVAGRHAPVVAAAAAARGIRYEGPTWGSTAALVRLEARAMRLAAAARLSRLRAGPPPRSPATVAAFVHRAFWKAGRGDGAAESYIGPVLRALESRIGAEEVRYVGIGPRSNFRARRWWDPLSGGGDVAVVPIERYAPAASMRASHDLYARRHEIRRQMCASADLRAHAVIGGVDCWPLVREQLAGIALLQFPWSARAMDEAAAALAALRPDAAVTYAEAGGWGRALALEARRLGVPLAGLQHGFIYRHWLNYRHEPDEMLADAHNGEDSGFPLPAKTLLFDEHAAAHLRNAGHFPAAALAVTGSARLDELVATVRGLVAADLDRVRREAGADADRTLVVFAAKEREARSALPALIAAVRSMPGVQLAIKPHPAETPEVYAEVAGDIANVRVLAADAPLPPLLAAARGLVTVNSTVAIDALALGLPTLVIGLPNNLSPFVETGTMLGARSDEETREGLRRLLYDQEFRSRIESGRSALAGGAAEASAEAILALRQRRP